MCTLFGKEGGVVSVRVATFSDRLKEGMNIRKMRSVDLARRSNLSESLISNYRSGRFEAAQVNLQKLAEALDVSIAWLMGYDVPMGAYAARETSSTSLLSKLKLLSPSQLAAVEAVVDSFLEVNSHETSERVR